MIARVFMVPRRKKASYKTLGPMDEILVVEPRALPSRVAPVGQRPSWHPSRDRVKADIAALAAAGEILNEVTSQNVIQPSAPNALASPSRGGSKWLKNMGRVISQKVIAHRT
jgi:hypothetical protein